MADDKLQGEGNYDAARRYDKEATEFAKDKAKVKQAAAQANKALDGPERDALEAAEKAMKFWYV